MAIRRQLLFEAVDLLLSDDENEKGDLGSSNSDLRELAKAAYPEIHNFTKPFAEFSDDETDAADLMFRRKENHSWTVYSAKDLLHERGNEDTTSRNTQSISTQTPTPSSLGDVGKATELREESKPTKLPIVKVDVDTECEYASYSSPVTNAVPSCANLHHQEVTMARSTSHMDVRDLVEPGTAELDTTKKLHLNENEQVHCERESIKTQDPRELEAVKRIVQVLPKSGATTATNLPPPLLLFNNS